MRSRGSRPAWTMLLALAILGSAAPAKAEGTGEDSPGAPRASEGEGREKENPAPTLRFEKISKSCYVAVQGPGGSNAGFIVGEDAILVVDCLGAPSRAEKLLGEIRRVSKAPITHVALTHWHYDHSVGSQALPWVATVVAATGSADRLRKRLAKDRLLLGPGSGMHGSLDMEQVRNVNLSIPGEHELDLGGIVVKLAVLGECHSAGDMIVYVPSEKILFAGDLLWNGLHPNISEGHTFRWITALARMEKLEVTKIVPGHGDTGDKGLLNAQRRYLMVLRRTVKHLLKRKVAPEEIVAQLEVPEPYRDLGFTSWWSSNVRYVCRELLDGD